MNQQAQTLHWQNRQIVLSEQVRLNRYSGYYQDARDSENIQNKRQVTRDSYPQEAQHTLQKIE